MGNVVPRVDGRKFGGKISEGSGVEVVLMRLEPVSNVIEKRETRS